MLDINVDIDDDLDVLRPYPIDPAQDRIVRKLVNAKQGCIPRIGSFIFRSITYPVVIVKRRWCTRPFTDDYLEKKISEIPRVYVSKKLEAMDSKFYFVIRDGILWFKPIAAHSDAPWKSFGRNGLPSRNSRVLINVSADGDNLLVVDDQHIVHYAKSNKIIYQVSFDCPQWSITKFKVKWTTKWFNMDIVSLFVNLFIDPALIVGRNNRSIAMSHKGHSTIYYTDMNGKKHPDPYIGVTTVYMLNDDGTRLFFADPWLQSKFRNEITMPEDGRFKAESMAASASTLFLIQRAIDTDGKETHKMYTRFADFDSIGSNPALKATYNPRNRIPLIRFIPAEDWLEQPTIQLHDQARLTKNISVLQIGCGQNNRQLRVQGLDSTGRPGFYHKNIYHRNWSFELTDDIVINQDEFLSDSTSWTGFERGPRIAFDYQSGQLRSRLVQQPKCIRLENFSRQGYNERNLHTRIVVEFENNTIINLKLYARRGWLSLMRISDENIWTLIIPDQYFHMNDSFVQEFLHRVFASRYRHEVKVYEKRGYLIVESKFFSRGKFKFLFKTNSN